MVFRKISAEMKQRALQLIDEGWELAEVAEVLGVSSASVERWEDNYKLHGRVDPPSVLRGRPRLLNAQVIDDLHHFIQESPYLYLDEIREWLALYHDQPISMTALHNNLRRMGLSRKIMRKAAAERDRVARAEWLAYVTSTFSAEEMVILDESSKDGRTIARRYGRAPVGERPVTTESLDRGIRYSILPALTVNGYMSVRVVEGSINGAEFYDFVINDVVIIDRLKY